MLQRKPGSPDQSRQPLRTLLDSCGGDAAHTDSIARCPYKMPVPWRCEKAAEVGGDLEILRNWLEREPRDLNEPTGGRARAISSCS